MSLRSQINSKIAETKDTLDELYKRELARTQRMEEVKLALLSQHVEYCSEYYKLQHEEQWIEGQILKFLNYLDVLSSFKSDDAGTPITSAWLGEITGKDPARCKHFEFVLSPVEYIGVAIPRSVFVVPVDVAETVFKVSLGGAALQKVRTRGELRDLLEALE